MVEKKKSYILLIILIIILTALNIGVWYYIVGKKVKEDETVKNKNIQATQKQVDSESAITQLPQPGKASSIVINFANCSKGKDVVYFGFGSTHFSFEGINNDKCVFYYGTEIENPNWDGSLTEKCEVPVSLKEGKYLVNNYGIKMEGLSEYCSKR
ncbi:MAG: hypothetical protein Q7S53_01505 [bacterium]|nr:hypothetical protein [bacterium]